MPVNPDLEINFINFNQDCTSLAVGTKSGYKLYSLTSVDKLELIYECACKDVIIVERLFSSSLLALVSLAAPRKLKVCHFKKGTEICNYSYSNTILGVKLNRARLVVCLEESLYIHNIRDMKILHTIRETPPNPKGLCALSINSDNCFLAYPGSSTTGEVQLFDAFNLQGKLMIPAHDAPLAALSFNPAGTKLATASERGTVIRVFSVLDGTKLIEFRRGVKRCAQIYSLSFSQDSQFLALSSNTETIHIFKMEEPSEEEQAIAAAQGSAATGHEEPSGWMGYLSKAVEVSASYLPAQVTDTLNQSRAIATVTVPTSTGSPPNGAVPNTVAIANLSRQLRLLLASSDGYLYIYNIPVGQEVGGECVMVKQHRIEPDCGGSGSGGPGLAFPDNVEHSEPVGIRGSEEGPAVLDVTQESHSPTSIDDSPPPAIQRPDL